VFLLGLAVLVVTSRAPWWVLPWYLLLSVATFLIYGWDKLSASGGHWRTSESTLNGIALVDGWPGGWIAQHAWRHKSRKTAFQDPRPRCAASSQISNGTRKRGRAPRSAEIAR
jgi:uncharacterized membrane protein YsdA (DUF1294 family)